MGSAKVPPSTAFHTQLGVLSTVGMLSRMSVSQSTNIHQNLYVLVSDLGLRCWSEFSVTFCFVLSGPGLGWDLGDRRKKKSESQTSKSLGGDACKH
jgi:hypothetical protein